MVVISDGGYPFLESLSGDVGGGTVIEYIGHAPLNREVTQPNGQQTWNLPDIRTNRPDVGTTGWFHNLEQHVYDVRNAQGTKTRTIVTESVESVPGYSGLSGSNALPSDEETLLYPDLGLAANNRPRLPGDARPQQPTPNDVNERSTWRDAWLEAAVTKIATSKKRNEFTMKQRRAMQARGRRFMRRGSVFKDPDHKNRMRSCGPSEKNMVPLTEAPTGDAIVMPNRHNATRQDFKKFDAQLSAAYSEAMSSGKICYGHNKRIYVASGGNPLPKVELAHKTPHPLKELSDFPEFKSMQEQHAMGTK